MGCSGLAAKCSGFIGLQRQRPDVTKQRRATPWLSPSLIVMGVMGYASVICTYKTIRLGLVQHVEVTLAPPIQSHYPNVHFQKLPL